MKLEEDLVTSFGRSWSHFGWRKFHNGNKCGSYRERMKITPLNSSISCNSFNIFTSSPLHPCLHICTLTQCTPSHPPSTHTHTLTLGTLLFLQPVLHENRAVESGLQSASTERDRGSQSLLAAALHTATGASWESEPTHWDCRPW